MEETIKRGFLRKSQKDYSLAFKLEVVDQVEIDYFQFIPFEGKIFLSGGKNDQRFSFKECTRSSPEISSMLISRNSRSTWLFRRNSAPEMASLNVYTKCKAGILAA